MGERLRALDGLRGVAVLMVVADHTGLARGYPIGVCGVAVFFVLSGFLITRVIVDARERGEWSMRHFLTARAVRLLPALLLVEVTIVGWWLIDGRPFSDIGWHVAASTFYVENLFQGQFPTLLLNHTWSLAVEEQFYLLWPLALPLVMRVRSPILVIGAAVVGSMLARVGFALVGREEQAYASLPANAFALLLGALLAVDKVSIRSGRTQRTVAVCGVALIGVVVALSPGGNTTGPIGVTLASMVVVAFALPGVPLLELGWLRFLGRISYALYLWHWPVLVLLDQVNGRASALPAIALSFVLATVSTFWLEEPLRRRWRARQAAPGALVRA